MANTYLSTDRLLKNEIDTKRSLTDNSFTQLGFVLNEDTSVRLRSIVQGVLNIDNPLGTTNTDATIEVSSTSVAKSILSNNGGGNNVYLSANGISGEETVSVKEIVGDNLRDLTARAISLESTIGTTGVIIVPTVEGNGLSLVQFGITGDEYLDILPGPGQAGDNRGIRCLYTLFRDLPGTENDKKLYYDSAYSTRLLVDNQGNQIAYVSDVYAIDFYGTAYTGTTWTSNYATAITNAWNINQIVQIDPASNNEEYTINTATLDAKNKVRVWNISAQNHNAHIVVNGITYVVGPNAGLTAIKTPNSYSAFGGV